jgi:hypothetical protein
MSLEWVKGRPPGPLDTGRCKADKVRHGAIVCNSIAPALAAGVWRRERLAQQASGSVRARAGFTRATTISSPSRLIATDRRP